MPPRRQTTDRAFPPLPPLNAESKHDDVREPTLRNVLARIALVRQHRVLDEQPDDQSASRDHKGER